MRACVAAFELARHVVGRGHLAPAARGGERGIAIAGGDVEHLLPGPEVERLAQLLADDLQRGADNGVVAGRPGAMLLCLQRGKIDLAGLLGFGGGGCGHELAPSGVWTGRWAWAG